MPANEQTWRDSKLMHTVFAVSAVLMLLATVWMMGDDNDRPWKDYQRKFNSLDLWTTDARITEQKSADYEKKLEELEKAVKDAQAQFTAADRDAAEEFARIDKQFTEEMAQLVKEANRDFPVTRDPLADGANRQARHQPGGRERSGGRPQGPREAAGIDERRDHALHVPRRPFHAGNKRQEGGFERGPVGLRSGRR